MTRCDGRALSIALGLSAAVAISAHADLHALNLSIARPDMERALALARWPHTDAERVRFHDRYLTLVNVPRAPVSVVPTLVQLEVITEFRRVELLTEEHDRAGDQFGRGGMDEVVEALRPWRGKLAVDAYLDLPGGTDAWVPPTSIAIVGVGEQRAFLAARSVFHSKPQLQTWTGWTVESLFDAEAVGQTTRAVRVVVDGRELARVRIDFSALE